MKPLSDITTDIRARDAELAIQIHKDIAEGRAFVDSVRQMGAGWAAEVPPEWPAFLRGKIPEDAVPWSKGFDPEVRKAAFDHLVAVQDVEARNQGRLKTLLWAIEVLKEDLPESAAALWRWTAKHYPKLPPRIKRVEGSVGPLVRERLSIAATRDYTAMPRNWREAL